MKLIKNQIQVEYNVALDYRYSTLTEKAIKSPHYTIRVNFLFIPCTTQNHPTSIYFAYYKNPQREQKLAGENP